MAYSRTTNFNFFRLGNQEINWHHFLNYNFEVVEENTKLRALLDVDVTKLVNGSILRYNTITEKWEIVYNREVK